MKLRPWFWAVGIAFLLLMAASDVLAAPAIINVTPTSLTEDGTGGVPDRYALYRGCDLANQTVGQVIADPVVVNTTYSFNGDTDNDYQVCVRAFNAAGAGGFTNVVTLSFNGVVLPPGRATIILNCDVDPSSGVVANCVQVNNP